MWWTSVSFRKFTILRRNREKARGRCVFFAEKFGEGQMFIVTLPAQTKKCKNFEARESRGFTETVQRPSNGALMEGKVEFWRKLGKELMGRMGQWGLIGAIRPLWRRS